MPAKSLSRFHVPVSPCLMPVTVSVAPASSCAVAVPLPPMPKPLPAVQPEKLKYVALPLSIFSVYVTL